MSQSVLDFPNIIAAWWWIDPTYITDAAMIAGIEKLNDLNFTASIPWDDSICQGTMDDDLTATKAEKFINFAASRNHYVVLVVWGTGTPTAWYGHDWDEPAFRTWYGTHLQKLGAWINTHPNIVALMFDDCEASLNAVNDYAEWDAWVREKLNLTRDILFIYDCQYNGFTAQGLGEAYTASLAYMYCYQFAGCQLTQWVTDTHNRYVKNAPAHTVGICFNTFEQLWTASMLIAQANVAMTHEMLVFNYYAWRRGDPETTRCIYSRPEYHSAIQALNANLIAYLNELRGSEPPPPPPPPDPSMKSCNALGLGWGFKRWVVTETCWK